MEILEIYKSLYKLYRKADDGSEAEELLEELLDRVWEEMTEEERDSLDV